MTRFLLVHPPLLGPAVWANCAAVLRAAGHRVVVPDLRRAVDPAAGWWSRWVDACAGEVGNVDLVAGHSGAGVVLPLIAEATAARSLAFVDAVVPSTGSVSAPSESLLAFVRALPSDDHLPPWTAWWSEDAVAEILPDPELRARITAEQPRLPTDFYDHPVPVPPQWTDGRAITYVRFSEAYEHDAAEATRRSWTVGICRAVIYTCSTTPTQWRRCSLPPPSRTAGADLHRGLDRVPAGPLDSTNAIRRSRRGVRPVHGALHAFAGGRSR
jgi:hypothetical protein